MKHLKISLTVIVSIFSFLFIDNVLALNYTIPFNDTEVNVTDFYQSIYNADNTFLENNPKIACASLNKKTNKYVCYANDTGSFGTGSTNKTDYINIWNNGKNTQKFVIDHLLNVTFYGLSSESINFYKKDTSSYGVGFANHQCPLSSGIYQQTIPTVDELGLFSIFNINFHLNGGTIEDDINDIVFNEDFSVSLYGTEIENFIRGLVFKKSGMVFEGMYYDNTYNNPFNITDTIMSDIDLYVKWTFASVDDFLKNVSFNEYIFDTNYEYAIISKGNHNDDIYFGLDFANYSLEIFEYRPDLNSYKDGSSVCLTPIYSKDGKYYYNVNTLYTSNYEIFVLPRSIFDNNIESDYSFLLTDNAYVTYTNDLKDTVIVDKNGNELHTNLKDSYELSQSYLNEYKNADSNFNIMKKYLNELKSINSVWNECFDLFYSSLPTICKSFLIFVFNVIMILIFLKLVGWK